jgi:hypothetical protein
VFTVHATKKLLERVKQSVEPPVGSPQPLLESWYETVLFWRPQAVLLVNEVTLLPVLMPLAPGATLLQRFPDALQMALEAHGVDRGFIRSEIAAMNSGRFSKTANRSVLGVMNDFGYLASHYRADRRGDDLVSLAVWLARTPTGPLSQRAGSPDRELHALVGRGGTR